MEIYISKSKHIKVHSSGIRWWTDGGPRLHAALVQTDHLPMGACILQCGT